MHDQPIIKPICVSVKTASQMTGKSAWVIYQAIKGGHLKAYNPKIRQGTTDMVIMMEDLEAWIRGS